MNILHVISVPASGGAEVYVKDLAKYLAQQHNVHVAFLSSAIDAGRSTVYEKEFLRDLELSGVKTYIIGNETRKKPWLGALRVRKYVKKHNIEIMHAHLAYGILFSALSKIPVVYTHHTIEQRWNAKIYSVFNVLVDEYVGISKICAAALSEYTGKNVNTISNAVTLDKFEGYVRARLPRESVNIVMVGRLAAAKDYLNMLRALTLLDESIRQQISVSIAGEGEKEYKDNLVSYIKKHSLQNVVHLVGLISNIPQFLYGADLFVMSSSHEGLPIALTEAVISGLPCIVTDVGGCSEIIEHSNNGIVVEPHSSQALANAITKLVIDKSLIKQMSQNALDSAENYSISKAAKLHYNLYLSIIQ